MDLDLIKEKDSDDKFAFIIGVFFGTFIYFIFISFNILFSGIHPLFLFELHRLFISSLCTQLLFVILEQLFRYFDDCFLRNSFDGVICDIHDAVCVDRDGLQFFTAVKCVLSQFVN